MLERRSGVHRREGFMHCWWKMPDARLWETFHWSRVISFPSPPAGLFQKKTNNKRKQSKKSSPQQHTHIHAMHKISTVDFCFVFRRSISSRLFSTLFSSGNNPHLGFFLCVCLSFLFSFHHVVGVPYLFFYKHTEEDWINRKKILSAQRRIAWNTSEFGWFLNAHQYSLRFNQ